MGKKTAHANHSFMMGSFIFIILLFITIFIFLMWAFKAFQKQDEAKRYTDTYEITLDRSVINAPMTLYINDSLIFSGTPTATMTLQINRFEDECTLLAVDTESDQVLLIPLPDESAHITLHRDGTEFSAE